MSKYYKNHTQGQTHLFLNFCPASKKIESPFLPISKSSRVLLLLYKMPRSYTATYITYYSFDIPKNVVLITEEEKAEADKVGKLFGTSWCKCRVDEVEGRLVFLEGKWELCLFVGGVVEEVVTQVARRYVEVCFEVVVEGVVSPASVAR